MNWKKSIHAVISLVSAVAIAQSGVETMATTDLSRKPYTGVSWTWTACSDVAVRLAVQKNGDDFPTAGWGGTLFIGDGTLGCAVPGVPYMYNELLFDVERGLMPTNGRYAVQIIATNAAGRVEEWSRGMLTVRANPAAEGMPTNWNAYADLAAKVAPYINAEGILTSPDNAGALWGAVSNRTADLIIHSTTGALATLEADVSALQSATQTLQGAVGEMRNNTYTKGEADAGMGLALVQFANTNDVLSCGPYLPATGGTIRASSPIADDGIIELVKPGIPMLSQPGSITSIRPGEISVDKGLGALRITPYGFVLDYIGDVQPSTYRLPSKEGVDAVIALTSDIPDEQSIIQDVQSIVEPVAEAVSNKLDGISAYPEWNANIPYFQLGRVVYYKGRLWQNTNTTFHGAPPGTVGSAWTDKNVNISTLKQDALPYPTNAIPYSAIADKPDHAGLATNAAEAVVREKSLGGIWDRELEVWWTPVMRNGALTYQATTNVNLNAEGNQ